MVPSPHFIQSGERTPQRGGPLCVRYVSGGRPNPPSYLCSYAPQVPMSRNNTKGSTVPVATATHLVLRVRNLP